MPPDAPLYRRLLGDAYGKLPTSLWRMHALKETMAAEGVATVTRGKSLLARSAAVIVGFPKAGENIPGAGGFQKREWCRTLDARLAGKSFHSTQEQGRGRNEWLVCERFGPLMAGMALVVEDGKLRLIVRRWSLFGIFRCARLAPRGIHTNTRLTAASIFMSRSATRSPD